MRLRFAELHLFGSKGYDVVVMNPPFHVMRKPDPSIGQGFIRRASALLTPRGELWMVANRNLPYEADLEDSFQKVTTVAQDAGFKVIHAQRPKATRPAR